MKKIIPKIMICIAFLCIFCACDKEDTTINGQGFNWPYDPSSATLIISGKGSMPDYSFDGENEYSHPWNEYRTEIKNIVIENGITRIGEWAFGGCEKATNISIANSVTHIGSVAFDHCISLESINIPNSVTYIESEAFCFCFSLKEITVPNSVTVIEGGTFAQCTAMEKIVIGSGVTSIGSSTFYGCSKLAEITVLAIIPPKANDAFSYQVDLSLPVYVPQESVDAYKTAEDWKEFTNIQAIS